MQADSSGFVASFAKGLSVIRCFGPDRPRMTLSEVAARTGFSRATARRFLLTLVSLDYATTDGKHFELTPLVMTLGHAYLASVGFWDGSRQYLEEVTRQTQESCSIGILDKGEVVYVARSSAPHRILSDALYVGVRLAAHATSMGQVLLAALPEAEFAAYLRTACLTRFTDRTLTDPSDLARRIAQVRQQGYALVDQELESGLISLSLPLTDPFGKTVAALNISAPASRVDRDALLTRYHPYLARAGERIGGLIAMAA